MARIYYTTSSTSLSSFTGNTDFNEKVSLTFTPNANKTYAIFWSAVVSGSSITNVNTVRFRKTTGTSEVLQQFETRRDEINEEHSWTSVVLYTAPTSPTQESFAVEGKTSVTTDSIYVSDTYITALELTADDIFVSASASTSTNVNTYSTTDTITVGAGDWFIFGAASYNVNTVTIGSRGLMGIRLSGSNGTTFMETDSWYSEFDGNWTPYWAIGTASVAGSTSFDLQFKDNSAGSTSLRYRTLLGLKKSGFDESFVVVDEAPTQSFQARVTKLRYNVNPTVTGDTLVLSTWCLEPPQESSVQATSNLLKNDVSVFTYAGELLQEGQSINDQFNEGYVAVDTFTTSPVSWSVYLDGQAGSFPATIKNVAILSLALQGTSEVLGPNFTQINQLNIGNPFRISQSQIGSFVRGIQ